MGLNGKVYALCEYNGFIYAGGAFTAINSGGIAHRIAKWDGSSWSDAGDFNANIYALCVYNNELYAGGAFTIVDGGSVDYIAKWNGANWSRLSILDLNSQVQSLKVYNGELCVGGAFNFAGGGTANKIARWNGVTWSLLSTGIIGNVLCLGVYGGELYAGGLFTSAGGVSVGNIAKWNGTIWSDPLASPNDYVFAMDSSNGKLFIGGKFTVPGQSIAQFDGTTWSGLGVGVAMDVYAISNFGGKVYAGGLWRLGLGGNYLGDLGEWDGSFWVRADTGVINGEIDTLLNASGNFYCGGDFNPPNGAITYNVARVLPYNPLPVALVGFDVICNDNVTRISWTTLSESNNNYFAIERSKDNTSFWEIGRVQGSGNCSEMHSYSFYDRECNSGLVYYQLVQVDFDGRQTFSETKSKDCNDEPQLSYSFELNLLGIRSEEKGLLIVVDRNAEEVGRWETESGGKIVSLSNYNAGIYIALFRSLTRSYSIRFVKM